MDTQDKAATFKDLTDSLLKVAQESPTYQKMGHYIADNYKNIIFMTASDVAEECSVSQGSVSRFCKSLGYKGYNDFLNHLQSIVREEITAPQRLAYSNSRSLSNIIQREHQNIDELEGIIHSREYEELVKKILQADEVVLISARMSATLLSYTRYILNKLKDNVVQVEPFDPNWSMLEIKNPEKTLIFSMVFPRYPDVLIKKLNHLFELGFSIVAITDSVTSPVHPISDISLNIPITKYSIFDIYSTPILFLNLLLRDVSKAIPNIEDRMEKMEENDNQNSIYYGAMGESH